MEQVAILEDAKKHIAAVKQKRARLDVLAPVIAKLIFSITPDLTNQKTAQLAVNNDLYDGSGMQSLKIWAAGIVGKTADRDGDWQHLRFRNNKANTLPGVPAWQKDTEDMGYSMLDQSNFYEWAYDFAHTAGWYCTAAAFIEPLPLTKTLVFHELQPGSYWIDQDRTGTVNVLYREFHMAAAEILKTWPNLNPAFKTELERDRYAMHTVGHFVRPRTTHEPEDIGNRNFPFQSLYMAKGNTLLLEESGYKDFPFIVYRVRRQAGTPWGAGPGLDMIRDGQIQQAVAEVMLLADEKLVDPPMEGPTGITVDRDPGAMNLWDDRYLGKVKPLPQGIQRPVGMDREAMLRQTFERHYNVDTFLTQSRSSTPKTATEVMGIQAEQSDILTPIYSGWTSQVFDPMFAQIFKHAIEFKIFPMPPANLADMDLGGLDIKYVGSAATLRKRYRSVTGVEALANTTFLLKKAYPELAEQINDNTDPDVLMALAMEGTGTEVAKVDDATKKKNRATRTQALALQAQQVAQAQAIDQMQKGGLNNGQGGAA